MLICRTCKRVGSGQNGLGSERVRVKMGQIKTESKPAKTKQETESKLAKTKQKTEKIETEPKKRPKQKKTN
ncbi:hypothetical protein Hanom_Chr02g00167291 [Helianthus anomalus]